MSHIDRRFRLASEAGGLGLSCTKDGLTLAGAPLLRRTVRGFEPRSIAELRALMLGAYGEEADLDALRAGLGVAAKALNTGDLGRAMAAALHLKLPEPDSSGAKRLANLDGTLAKYDFNPAELRDWLGRWARSGADASPPEKSDEPPAQLTPDAVTHAAETLLPGFKAEFDDLGPVAFSKKVAQFGSWLEQQKHDGRPFDMVAAKAEYLFLQDRLNFWLAYPYKSPRVQENLLSAAFSLYQGAVNSDLADASHFPKSMTAVIVGAMP